MDAQTLDVEFYRGRAHLCHRLAEGAKAAKPLFTRLYVLAQAYEEKARAAQSHLRGEAARHGPSVGDVDPGPRDSRI